MNACGTRAGTKVEKGEAIFPRIDAKKELEELEKEMEAQKAAAQAAIAKEEEVKEEKKEEEKAAE